MLRRIYLSIALLVGGCATMRPRESFPTVAADIESRTTYAVHWNDGGAADAAVTARVAALLAKPLDADAAAQIALLNNHHLQAAYEDLGVAQADLVAAGLLTNPVLDGSVRFVSGGGSPTIDLGVAFDFLDLFFVGLRKKIASAEFDVVKARLTATVISAASDVKAAFYDLQAATQRVELRQQTEQATAASLDLAERLRAAGNNRAMDVAQERATHEEADLALQQAKADAVLARERLARGMGVAADGAWTVGGRLPELPADEALPANVEKTFVDQSLALAAARGSVTLQLRKLGITQPLATVPSAEVGASAERQDGQWEVGPAFALPLPLFNQGQPAIARAQALVRQERERYAALQLDVASHAREALTRVSAARRCAERYRLAILPLRKTILDETMLQYNAMQVPAFQLLSAKRDQITAAGAYLEALRDYWIARNALELGLHGGAIDTHNESETR